MLEKTIIEKLNNNDDQYNPQYLIRLIQLVILIENLMHVSQIFFLIRHRQSKRNLVNRQSRRNLVRFYEKTGLYTKNEVCTHSLIGDNWIKLLLANKHNKIGLHTITNI